MIIDTSALVATIRREAGYAAIADALVTISGIIPLPVLIELRLVTSLEGNLPNPVTEVLIGKLLSGTVQLAVLDAEVAGAASSAIQRYGKGNGSGGVLNIVDLMVYGFAKAKNMPILCTGKDFASTDALIHPASRIG